MKFTQSFLAARRMAKEPVPFQEILPLKLKDRVSGKGDSTSEVCCVHEMSVMFSCFKDNEFNQSLCSKEIENFQKCYQNHLTSKSGKREKEVLGVLTPGEKNLSHKQLNRVLKMYPNKRFDLSFFFNIFGYNYDIQLMKRGVTPNRKVINGINAPQLENALNQKRKQQQSKHSLIWGTVNIAILAIIVYDLTYTCPLYTSYIQYVEYVGAVVLLLNILYHFGRYMRLNFARKTVTSAPVVNTNLNTSIPGTPPNKLVTPELTTPNHRSLSSTPMNTSALSWMTNSSPNESFNYAIKSDSWLYSHGSPQNQSVSPIKLPRQDTSGIEFISNQDTLQTYLKDFEMNEKKANVNSFTDTTSNALSSFWSHPVTKNPKDASTFLKRCQYQLSSPTARPPLLGNQLPPCKAAHGIPNYYYGLLPPITDDLQKVVSVVQNITNSLISPLATSSSSPKTDDKGSPHGSPSQGMETWRRLSVDVVTLTQWNANLRMWLSQTILVRLIKEFDNVDDTLQKHGLTDIQIGKVGLDRLRKTAQTALVLQFIPTLPTIVPFLELSPNQEYLVKRIKELARGGCMSEFKWNSGGNFNGKDWDNSLPTDSAIIMHLFATYLDTQLLPLPSQPDMKPFSGYHYLKQNEKLPTLTDQTLLLHQCSDYPPHYRVVIGQEIYELVKGYNNLFHSILLFLYFVNKKQHGMIGRVNLGRAGVNLLWIIQS